MVSSALSGLPGCIWPTGNEIDLFGKGWGRRNEREEEERVKRKGAYNDPFGRIWRCLDKPGISI